MTEDLQVQVTGLSHELRGIARWGEKVVFVSGALPGEEVTLAHVKRHRHYDEAEVLQVLSPSPHRVQPFCPHFGVCGGCSAQHISLDFQLKSQQDLVLEQMKAQGVVPDVVLPPLKGSDRAYRRKARLGVKWVQKKNKICVGFREKNPRYLADLHTCPILPPQIGLHLDQWAEWISGLEAYQSIPQIEVAVGAQATALVLRHLEPLSPKDLDRLSQWAQKSDYWMYLQPQGEDSIHLLYPNRLPYQSPLNYRLESYGLQMTFEPSDFIQVHEEVNEMIIAQVLSWLEPQPEDCILDLFFGLGNLNLPLAQLSLHVTGIEGSKKLTQRALDNAQRNGLSSLRFYVADLYTVAESKPWPQWLEAHYDKIVLDPPRSGAKEILPTCIQKKPQKIVYVSCNPQTLARDAALLAHGGYRCTELRVFGMFPQTAHIETLACFQPSTSLKMA